MKTLSNKVHSPRISALRQALQGEDTAALDLFWKEVAEQGAPLIEPINGDPDHSLVTFLWRGDAGTKRVIVRSSEGSSGLGEQPLSQLPATDVWHVTCRLRNDFRGVYKIVTSDSLLPGAEVEQPDPLNPKTFIEPGDQERPDQLEDDIDSVVELPAAPPQPWVAPRAGTPKGQVKLQRLRSDLLGNERRIWVYTPPAYETTRQPYGLLVVLDGRFFTFAIPTPTILDNLLADGLIPPLVAVLVDNPGHTWEQAQETRQKELACWSPFVAFLAQELVPWVYNNYHLTADPAQSVLAGSSIGGLAAAFVAMQRPQTFGNVLSLSGSFWWKPEDQSEWEWLARQFALHPLLPLRFYLEVGLLESVPQPNGNPGQVLANQHMRDVLQARDYPVQYQELGHGHDAVAWQGALADGLIALMGRNRDE